MIRGPVVASDSCLGENISSRIYLYLYTRRYMPLTNTSATAKEIGQCLELDLLVHGVTADVVANSHAGKNWTGAIESPGHPQ